MADSVISVEYKGRIATITISNEKKLNALNQQQYYEIAKALREIATHDEVYITVLLAKGRFFSAQAPETESDVRQYWMRSFLAFNLNITQAFYTHPKILVVGLNGPVIGLSAAIVAHADFIYCAPHAFLLTPFSSLGLVAEGGASRALVQRLGPARSNEALIMSKRITAEQLERAGFVNAVFQTAPNEDARFRDLVLNEVEERLGPHLNGDSLLGIKKLIRRPERDVMDVQNAREVFDGLDRFVAGIPQEEFRKIASGEKRHKL
ncbi:putativetrans-enoylisomerase [Diaporthe ampelina]|uniref:Putativetrans-enoylisomerase n=1 Tax=Diaporthe ampelina TaxID=1214573 RepID=A0A0G2FWA0_9PEZI|nr:putativetrans-enoylisomerase [Diaporthe ampelina]